MASNRVAVLTGQVRDGRSFVRLLQLLSELPIDRIIVSTWSTEPLADYRYLLRAVHGHVVTVDPVLQDGWGNSTRQRLLLESGLAECDPDDLVMKLRPDLSVSRTYLSLVLNRMGLAEPLLAPSPFRLPVIVPWVNPQVPFRIGDEFFAGTAADLTILNRIDPLMSLVCPHIGRFAAPFSMLPSLQWLRESVVGIFAPSFAADWPGAIDKSFVRPARGLRRLRPELYQFFRSLWDIPTYAAAVADALFVCSTYYCVLNPQPESGPYLSRVGRPWSEVNYTDVATTSGPWSNPETFAIAYAVSPGDLARTSGSSTALARTTALLEDPVIIRAPLREAESAADSAATSRRYRQAAARELLSGPAVAERYRRRLRQRRARPSDTRPQ